MKAKVGKQKLNVIIDTGSSVTILASSIFNKMTQQEQPTLRSFNDKLLMADGSELPVLGVTDIPFLFDNLTITHATVIADIESDGLIGLDFMKQNNCEISYGRKTFSINGHSLKFKEELGGSVSCRIKAAQTVVIPPNSESVVQGRVLNARRAGDCAVTVPVSSILQTHGLFPGRVLINPRKGVVPICIANPSDEPIVLYKGVNIAIAQPVTSVHTLENPTHYVNQVQSKSWDDGIDIEKPNLEEIHEGPLQAHLQDLLDRSSTDLSENERLKTRNFLFQYAYIFSAGGNDIGRCDILKHQIPTGDNKPVKLPPRQIPIHLRDAVDNELDRLLDMGIIKPSASPWSSCIVVVRKSDGSIIVIRYLVPILVSKVCTEVRSSPQSISTLVSIKLFLMMRTRVRLVFLQREEVSNL